MGQRLARVALLSIPLGGCSLLYNSSDLPPPADAPPDMAPIIVPEDVTLESVSPAVLIEGTGVGGSRPVVLVLKGTNFVANNLRIDITPAAGEIRPPRFTIDMEKVQVETFGLRIAVPISVEIDTTLMTNQSIGLDVKVTQDGEKGPVSTSPLMGQLSIKGLNELRDSGAVLALNGGVQEFSEINVATTQLEAAVAQSQPIILRATSSVKITKDIALNAAAVPACGLLASCPGGPAGPAGGAPGGSGGTSTNGAGGAGGGPYPGLSAGGPGRFDTPDRYLASMLNPQNRSSGGGGGNGNLLNGGGGGGGGGGSIEISALGDLEIGAIGARGAAGGASSAQAGGGGSGGAILVRAGGNLKAGNLDVNGGGTGVDGRARYDAGGMAMVAPGDLGLEHHRGPMFIAPPFITRTRTPDLTVITKPLTSFRYFVIDDTGQSSELFDEIAGSDGTARITLQHKLQRGSNQICLVVEGGSASSDTRNCVQLAYLLEQ